MPFEAGSELGEVVEALVFKSFLHSSRNFFRSLPCRPLASACFEHSRDSGDFAAIFSDFEFVAARDAVAAAVMVIIAKAIESIFIVVPLGLIVFRILADIQLH